MIFNIPFFKRKTVKQRLIESISPNDKIQISLCFVIAGKLLYEPCGMPFYMYKLALYNSDIQDIYRHLDYKIEKTYDTFPIDWNEEKFVDYLSKSYIEFNSFSFNTWHENTYDFGNPKHSEIVIKKIINNWIQSNPLFSMEKIYSLLEQNDVPYSKISHQYSIIYSPIESGYQIDPYHRFRNKEGVRVEATDINSDFLKSLINLAWVESNGVEWSKKKGFSIK